MTSTPSPRPVSALRARMIEDMTERGFTEETRSNYIRDVRAFAAFIRRASAGLLFAVRAREGVARSGRVSRDTKRTVGAIAG